MLHDTTTNISALKMSLLYREMGIKNNKFFLQLNNELLKDIDPLDEDNLTEVQKVMITQEISENPWYFFREIVRIPAGGGLVKFEFHRGNIALIWAVLNDISTFTVWPRQTYKTTTMACIYDYMFYWGSVHSKIAFLAHEDSIVKKNVQGVKDIRDNLPTYLNMYDSKKDRDNEKEMFNRSTDNRISSRAPARNADGARKAGRGFSTPIQWFDEIAFIPFIGEMYDSISFAYAQASKSAKDLGAPYHQCMTTTAGFLSTEEGKWAKKFMDSCADFTEAYYDMDIDDVKNLIQNGSMSGFLDLNFMYYDLGKDENYLDEQRKRLVNSPTPEDTLNREVLNKWEDTSTEHPLGQERIKKLNTLKQKPLDIMVIADTYTMRMYKDMDTYDMSKCVIGGMDLGGNLRGDFSVLTIVDPEDFSTVAVMRTNSQSTTLFSIAIACVMEDVFPGLILFPERNFNGAIIDMIVSMIPNGTERVYHDGPDRPGLFNSKKVRPVLFNDILRRAIDDYGDRIKDKNIISEIEGLIRTRNGRIDHKPGEHDDTMMSWLLALYFLLYIPNKSDYMDPGIIGCKFKAGLETGEDINSRMIAMQKKRKDKIRRITSAKFEAVMNDDNITGIDDLSRVLYKDVKGSKPFREGATINVYDAGFENDIVTDTNSEDYDEESKSIIGEIETSDSISRIRGAVGDIKDAAYEREFHNTMTKAPSRKVTPKDFKRIFGSMYG